MQIGGSGSFELLRKSGSLFGEIYRAGSPAIEQCETFVFESGIGGIGETNWLVIINDSLPTRFTTIPRPPWPFWNAAVGLQAFLNFGFN